MREPASRFVRLRSLRAHFVEWPGDDPPVVLLHPNRTNCRVWDFVVHHSTLPRRFVAPDYRGHGLSDYLETGSGVDDLLADLEDLVERVDLAPVILVGAATGGNVALLYASRHPRAVSGLVVADPGLSLDVGRSRRVQDQIWNEFRFPDLDVARAAMPHSNRWSAAMREHTAKHSFRSVPGGGVEWRYSREAAAAIEEALEAPIWDEIRVECPTLVLRGAESETFPMDRFDRLLGMVPGSRGVTVPGAGHRIGQDAPEAFARLVDEFVARLPSP
jgi:pimeloyl-ACP methyl ester carboxylesterase